MKPAQGAMHCDGWLVARDGPKPGRDGQVWILHADAAWSGDRVENAWCSGSLLAERLLALS